MKKHEGKRWSGADWATEQREIMIVGCGGIGSWTALNLSRIGHNLILVDGDNVDETNVTGGQMFRTKDIGMSKAKTVKEICKEFGCENKITCVEEMFTPELGIEPIVITGLDNMTARKLVFDTWISDMAVLPENKDINDYLLIDGRLTLEMNEVFCIQGNNKQQIDRYKIHHLFSDEEANLEDCTTKQSTFGAMNIASIITATLCNWLTNNKLGMEMREVPFYQRTYLPLFKQDLTNILCEEMSI
jgi:hypothetical protein